MENRAEEAVRRQRNNSVLGGAMEVFDQARELAAVETCLRILGIGHDSLVNKAELVDEKSEEVSGISLNDR